MNIDEYSVTETNDYRIIIFPASRTFLPKEAKVISEKLYDFLATWAAHGKPLSSSFKFFNNQFIVICVDEEKEMASGCSIDSLNSVMRDIDKDFELGFFDRMKASYEENGMVKTMKLSEFRNAVKSGEISEDAEIFDFSKNTYLNFLHSFKLPLRQSWASVYLN